MSISISQTDNVGITVESDPLALKKASNLGDLTDSTAARLNLSLSYSSIGEALTNNPSPIKIHSAINDQIAQCASSVFGIQAVNWNSYISGAGAASGGGVNFYTGRSLIAPNALTAGYTGIAQMFGTNATNPLVSFSRPIIISGRFYSGSPSSSNAGLKVRYYFTNDGGGHTPNVIALVRKGFGWEYDYSTSVFSIITHDGTSQTVTAITAYNYTAFKVFDVAVYSDGTGNVSLYINGVLYGTATSTGVTGVGALSYAWVGFNLFQDVTTVNGGYSFAINNPKIYLPVA